MKSNIIPLSNTTDLNEEISFSNYELKKYFSFLCELEPDIKLQKIKIVNATSEFFKLKGLVYLIVVEDKIFKIGQTINSFKKRIESYNSGKNKYRQNNGTNSTTNYFVLQSIINFNVKCSVYYFCSDEIKLYSGEILGEKYEDFIPSFKSLEKIILKKFSLKYKKTPIGNIQN
jgi:hypothetical protein